MAERPVPWPEGPARVPHPVYVPYMPMSLSEATCNVLAQEGANVRYVDTSGAVNAYWKALCSWWAGGETFIVCEGDIIPWPGLLAEVAACEQEWCACEARIGSLRGATDGPTTRTLVSSLAFSKYERAAIRRHPTLARDVKRLRGWGPRGPDDDTGCATTHWHELDVRFKVLLSKAGLSPHVHRPMVTHVNRVLARPFDAPDGPVPGPRH